MTPADRERWHVLARHMQDLVQQPAWDALMEQLDMFHREQLEILVNAPAEARDRIAAYIKGMQHFERYPFELIQKVKSL